MYIVKSFGCNSSDVVLLVINVESISHLNGNCTLVFTRPISMFKPVKKKKASKSRSKDRTVSFATDFFEHCQPLNEVEFGGPDILHVYNTQQVKHRLLTAGMFITSTKVVIDNHIPTC